MLRPSGLVTLLTDFGVVDPYVGILKGAVLRAFPKAGLVDLGHAVPPQDVLAGAFWLAAAIDRFPPGTVHVAVVDPGVGTARRLLAVQAFQGWWLGPDNGLLAPVFTRDPAAELRALDLEHLQLHPASRTFHGRDVLAPVAGWLAGGRYGFASLGPRIVDPVPLALPASPCVVHVDHYGNLVTNVDVAATPGVGRVRVGDHVLAIRGTYADAAPGELLALVGSYGLVEIAVNCGNAAQTTGLGRGAPITVLPA